MTALPCLSPGGPHSIAANFVGPQSSTVQLKGALTRPIPPAKHFAKKGSQRWLQVAVERAPEQLDSQIRSAMKLTDSTSVEWLSPIRSEGFGEYRDEATFIKCGITLGNRALSDFWPRGGPMWDGLARTSTGDIILVEAKAHVPEIVSPRSRANEPARGKIVRAIRETQEYIAPKSIGFVDWTQTFYQYTNRLAHLHFLRENDVRAHLVNIYFLNSTDVNGPSHEAEWQGAIRVVECYLGVGWHRLQRFTHKVFVDVATLVPLVTAED